MQASKWEMPRKPKRPEKDPRLAQELGPICCFSCWLGIWAAASHPGFQLFWPLGSTPTAGVNLRAPTPGTGRAHQSFSKPRRVRWGSHDVATRNARPDPSQRQTCTAPGERYSGLCMLATASLIGSVPSRQRSWLRPGAARPREWGVGLWPARSPLGSSNQLLSHSSDRTCL